jgi:hypothetical protein
MPQRLQSLQNKPRRRGGRKPRYTADQLILALTASQGKIASAARRLGCDRAVVYKYLKKFPQIEEAVTEAREFQIDTTELKLFEAIEKGEPWAITLYLKTQGRSRGYIEKQEMDINASVDQTMKTLTLTDEELDAELLKRGLPLHVFDPPPLTHEELRAELIKRRLPLSILLPTLKD